MLSCRQLTEQASDYLERELGLRRRLQARFHLALCHHCRRYVAQIERTVATLRHLPKEPPLPEVAAAVLSALRKKKSAGAADP
jgi:anti-sigma factor RsiW